jgi:glycerol-3-phosphate O-acyltransferase/dihydroxyacetone phosphate acyltransferase
VLRSLTRAVFGVSLRVFFRRVEVVGEERVPRTGPVMFVMNHPNALVDPGILLVLAPRPVAFLAKAPLFRSPLTGFIVRAFDSIPIYRKQDEGGATDNRKTFQAARELLLRGQAIAIFPEGVSHNEPRLMPLKTGAARIALGTGLTNLTIVPAGIYYPDKVKFRSDALLLYGEPFTWLPGALVDGEPAAGEVQALTRRIEVALGHVTLQADETSALALVDRVGTIFAASSEAPWTLAETFDLRRRLVAGYNRLREADPEALADVERRVTRYERDLGALGMTPDHLKPADFTLWGSVRYALRSAGALGVLLPLALVGTALHYPAYLLTRVLARRMSEGSADMVATIKVLAATLLFPVTWIAAGVLVGALAGWPLGALAGLLAPACGAAALFFWERFATVGAAARGLLLFTTRRNALARLAADRAAIRAAILELAGRVEPA